MHSQDEEKATKWLRETQKGYIRIAVLVLLSRKPYHGYEIMREIKEGTRGFWRPTAGGIYPILRDLERSGYIQGEWDSQKKRKRKIYRITQAGKPVLEQALAKENQIANSMSNLFKEFMKDVLDVETETISTPRMPNLFSVFLEEKKERPEDKISVLESKRVKIKDTIEELQKDLGAIDKRLEQLKHPKKKTTQSEIQR